MIKSSKEYKQNDFHLPVHSLEGDSTHINILPLDYNNPYDYKREHRHTYFEIMFIEHGGGNQLIDFNSYIVRDNSCYIIFPQQVHLMNRKDSSGILVQFTEERISSPELLTALRYHSFLENAAVVFEHRSDLMEELKVILNLLRNYALQINSGSKLVVTHLLQSLVSLVLLNQTQIESNVLADDKKLLIDFYQLLENYYCENLGVQHYIQKLGTTEKKLSAAVRKYTGFSPLQIIHNRVLLEAKRILLFEQSTHKEIAFKLGFDSPASFSAFIKTKTGYSPSELYHHLAEIHK